jgi:hypothetical protein
MMLVGSLQSEAQRWNLLPDEMRILLFHKLKGLYGYVDDGSAFDGLGADKQNALVMLSGRLYELGLWDHVRRVENVYGEGGVGMNFIAWPTLKSSLQGHPGFTSWFARHKGTEAGFLETAVPYAALHILCLEHRALNWAAHFDLYSPIGSLKSGFLHLLRERVMGITPGWQEISTALANVGRKDKLV